MSGSNEWESIIGHIGFFQGIFQRYGSKNLWSKPNNILILSNILSLDHNVFIMKNAVLKNIKLEKSFLIRKGEIIEFRAKVISSHKFTSPKQIKKINQIPLAFHSF